MMNTPVTIDGAPCPINVFLRRAHTVADASAAGLAAAVSGLRRTVQPALAAADEVGVTYAKQLVSVCTRAQVLVEQLTTSDRRCITDISRAVRDLKHSLLRLQTRLRQQG